MIKIEPINQKKLFGLEKYIKELIQLDKKKILPNKILLSGEKGSGKSTLAFHFVNYVLSKGEKFNYDSNYFQINENNSSFRTILNKSNPNLITLDVHPDKKSIDISQIREMISLLNKSSFNEKPRFILIDNIEYMSVNSANAILKILEEPSSNVYFILINNNRKVPSTLLSRCINFKISLTHKESLEIANNLLNGKLDKIINNNLINYYLTPGYIYHLVNFAKENKYDLVNLDLKSLIRLIIRDNQYKKNNYIKNIIFDLIEFYFYNKSSELIYNMYEKYDHFLKRIFETKNFNLDEESLFIEFDREILNG